MNDWMDQVMGEIVAKVTGTLAPGGVYACPLDGCTEEWVIPDVVARAVDSTGKPDEFTAPGPMRVAYVGVTVEHVDLMILEHLRSHEPEDWVLTIAGLRTRIRELEALAQPPMGPEAFDHLPVDHPAPVTTASPARKRRRRRRSNGTGTVADAMGTVTSPGGHVFQNCPAPPEAAVRYIPVPLEPGMVIRYRG